MNELSSLSSEREIAAQDKNEVVTITEEDLNKPSFYVRPESTILRRDIFVFILSLPIVIVFSIVVLFPVISPNYHEPANYTLLLGTLSPVLVLIINQFMKSK